MIGRAHFTRPVVDNLGNLVIDSEVAVYAPGTTTPITDTLYTGMTGSGHENNPWTPDGLIDVYLKNSRKVRLGITPSGGSEFYIENLDIGCNLNWLTTVKDYGAYGDGVTDDTVAIQAALDDMGTNDLLIFPPGIYMISATLALPHADSITLAALAPAPQNRLGNVVLRVVPGSALTTMMACPEWLDLLGSGVKESQGHVLYGLSFDGNGFKAGEVHDTEIETTASTDTLLTMHGSGFKISHCFFVSSNSHGVVIAGDRSSSGALISESHENYIEGIGIRYTGGDGFHVMSGAQDSWFTDGKIQYCGGHCIYTATSTAGWLFADSHPSWGALDLMHFESSWNYRVHDNYPGSVGEYMDTVDGSGPTHYAIYIGGSKLWNVHDNSTNTNTDGGQKDLVWNIYLNGKGNCHDNTFIYQLANGDIPADNIGDPANGCIDDHSSMGSNVHDNIADSP